MPAEGIDTELAIIEASAPLIKLSIGEAPTEGQLVILNQALAVAQAYPELITLTQHALATKLNLEHTPNNQGYVCSLHNGSMREPNEAWRSGSRLNTSNGIGGSVVGSYSVYDLWGETEAEAIALRDAYLERLETRDNLPGRGITHNEWGGINVEDPEVTTDHIHTRLMMYLFVLGDGKEGWSRYGDSLKNSELFHPLLLDIFPIADLVEKIQTTYQGLMSMEPEHRTPVIEALKMNTNQVIGDFIAEHKAQILAAQAVIDNEEVAKKTLNLISNLK